MYMYYQCKNLEQNCWLHRNRYVPLMGNGTLLITEVITGNNTQKRKNTGRRGEGGRGAGRGRAEVTFLLLLLHF